MSQETVSFSVLLELEPDSDRDMVSERVAAVLGYHVDGVLSSMRGPAVRLFETQDEREALRVTAALRMRQLEVRCVQSQQWHSATRTAGARGLQLSDLVAHTTVPRDGATVRDREVEVVDSAEPAPAALVTDEQVSPQVGLETPGVEASEAARHPGALVLRPRTTAGGLGAVQQPRPFVQGEPAVVPVVETNDPSVGQGAAVFRFARRTVVTGEAIHSKPPTAEALASSATLANQASIPRGNDEVAQHASLAPNAATPLNGPVRQSASSNADRDFSNDERQELDALPSSSPSETGGPPPSTAASTAADRSQAFGHTSSSVLSQAPSGSAYAGKLRRTSGGSRTIDFEAEDSGLAGAELYGERDEAEPPDFAGMTPLSDPASGNFGSFEDELASVSALHEASVGPEQRRRAHATTKHTTELSNPVQVRSVTRKETASATGASGMSWFLRAMAAALLALGLGGLAMWSQQNRADVVAQFATAGFYAEFVELDRRYGCGRIEGGSQLCRANDAWYAHHFPGLRSHEAQLASDRCYFLRTDAGTTFTAQLQCTVPGLEGGEPPVHLTQSQRRTCEPSLDALQDNRESTCQWIEESSLLRQGDARPTLTSTTDTWRVRFLAERESLLTPGGSVSAREYRVTPSVGPEFVWSWSPDVAATVRETPIGGLPRMQMAGRILPSGRVGDSTLR